MSSKDTTVVCPHCGDTTQQIAVLAEFTCGECDRGFSTTQNTTAEEIEHLRDLLRRADAVVIWEHTPLGQEFQEEIEEALGIYDKR